MVALLRVRINVPPWSCGAASSVPPLLQRSLAMECLRSCPPSCGFVAWEILIFSSLSFGALDASSPIRGCGVADGSSRLKVASRSVLSTRTREPSALCSDRSLEAVAVLGCFLVAVDMFVFAIPLSGFHLWGYLLPRIPLVPFHLWGY
jgi:hypothetical protein